MTANARIAVVGASLTETDIDREPGFPVFVETMLQHRGMFGSIVRTFARDGMDIHLARYMGVDPALPWPYGNMGTLGAKLIAFNPTDIWICGDMVLNATVFKVSNQTLDQAKADAAQFVADLQHAISGVQMTYVRMIQPQTFQYGGKWYSLNDDFAALDAYLAQLMPRVLTIDYALIMATLPKLGCRDSIDGIHQGRGASKLMAGMAYDGCPALYPDLQTSAYPPFENVAALLAAGVNTLDPNFLLARGTLANLGFIT